LAGFALRALAVPALRGAAASAIGSARELPFIRAVLSEVELLDDREVRHGCRWIRSSSWLQDGPEQLLRLGRREAAAVLRLIDAMGGPHARKVETYRQLFEAGDEGLRRAVVGRLNADPSAGATDLLAMIAGRGSDELAREAASELRRRRGEGASGSVSFEGPSAGTDDLSSRKVFERFWRRFELAAPQERASLLEGLRSRRGEMIVPLREQMGGGNPLDRALSLQVGRALGVLGELSDRVYRLAHDPDPMVRSQALGALAELPGPVSVRILRAALEDADARVQANAVEALDRLDLEERVTLTMEKLDSPHGRVRANAVRSLLRAGVGRAGEVLLDMLDDPSGGASGQWSVGGG
jgi:hypothetical protein